VDIDLQVRLAAFNWLSEQVNSHGEDVLPRKLLEQGFEFQDQRIPLVGPQGIFKPRMLEMPISITTIPEGPYNDSYEEGKFLFYHYRDGGPDQGDNVRLRKVFELTRPLICFLRVVKSKYLAIWPVYIIGDDKNRQIFKVTLDDALQTFEKGTLSSAHQIAELSDARHAYLTATVKVRLQQRSFREKVLDAYRSQCSFCRLKHRELLDDAHIIPDAYPEGKPTITNGIALCKLHHSAFDSFILGVTPDHIIQVREDVLEEEDGPMLQYGLKGLHRTKLILPNSKNNWPSQDALAWKYERFTRAG
jgi:putative restriction endonuclease